MPLSCWRPTGSNKFSSVPANPKSPQPNTAILSPTRRRRPTSPAPPHTPHGTRTGTHNPGRVNPSAAHRGCFLVTKAGLMNPSSLASSGQTSARKPPASHASPASSTHQACVARRAQLGEGASELRTGTWTGNSTSTRDYSLSFTSMLARLELGAFWSTAGNLHSALSPHNSSQHTTPLKRRTTTSIGTSLCQRRGGGARWAALCTRTRGSSPSRVAPASPPVR